MIEVITRELFIKAKFLHFRAEGGHSDLHEILRVFVVDLELVRHLIQVFDGALRSQLEPVCDPDWVDALVDERLRLCRVKQ